MSPEQLEGKEIDARSDIFSFGATLYEMITGRKAFHGPSQASLIAALMSADPAPVSSVQPMATPALDRLIAKCLAKSADDRWQSVRDLLSELQCVAGAGSQAGVPAPVAVARRRRQPLPWIVAGVATLLFALSLLFTVAHLREQPPALPQVRLQIPIPDGSIFHWYDLPAVSPTARESRSPRRTNRMTAKTDCTFVRWAPTVATRIPVPGPVYMPIWSPDGKQIAFFGEDLYRIDANGGTASDDQSSTFLCPSFPAYSNCSCPDPSEGFT